MKDNFRHGVNTPARLGFSFIGQPADWTWCVAIQLFKMKPGTKELMVVTVSCALRRGTGVPWEHMGHAVNDACASLRNAVDIHVRVDMITVSLYVPDEVTDVDAYRTEATNALHDAVARGAWQRRKAGWRVADVDDIWSRIIAMPRPHELVDFPRKNADGTPFSRVAVWVLTQEEQELAEAEAQARVTRLLKDAVPKKGDMARGHDDLYNNCCADMLLFYACRHPDDITRPFFPAPDAVRKLSVDEISVLCTHYYSVQEKLGPIVNNMTQEETDAFIDRLAKSSDRYPLDGCSPGLLRTLVLSLVSRLTASPTDKSSPGSAPASASASSESETVPSAEG
jgi:hypothetical protein